MKRRMPTHRVELSITRWSLYAFNRDLCWWL